MDFSFTDEQQMLLDTTQRFIAERYDFEARNGVRASDEGWSRAVWNELAELGLLALVLPEAEGGIDAGPVGTLLVSRAIGEGLLLEPFLSSAIVASQAIVRLGSDAQRAEWLPAMAAGELVTVLAHDETGLAPGSVGLGTTATAEGDGWRIDGAKQAVYHAPLAGLVLVSARVGDGIGLFAVPPDAAGLAMDAYTSIDEQRVADLRFDGVRVGADARLGEDATEALLAVVDIGLAALCAEALGAMERILRATIEYTRSRVQFGMPIGGFQALQHRMADMLMHLEQARSMAYLAADQADTTDRDERQAQLSAAKGLMGQAARFIGQQSVQLHGGMGMTDELDVSHYFKRLLAFELRFGGTDEHLERYRRLRIAH